MKMQRTSKYVMDNPTRTFPESKTHYSLLKRIRNFVITNAMKKNCCKIISLRGLKEATHITQTHCFSKIIGYYLDIQKVNKKQVMKEKYLTGVFNFPPEKGICYSHIRLLVAS